MQARENRKGGRFDGRHDGGRKPFAGKPRHDNASGRSERPGKRDRQNDGDAPRGERKPFKPKGAKPGGKPFKPRFKKAAHRKGGPRKPD